jgi:hypothetical protein
MTTNKGNTMTNKELADYRAVMNFLTDYKVFEVGQTYTKHFEIDCEPRTLNYYVVSRTPKTIKVVHRRPWMILEKDLEGSRVVAYRLKPSADKNGETIEVLSSYIHAKDLYSGPFA